MVWGKHTQCRYCKLYQSTELFFKFGYMRNRTSRQGIWMQPSCLATCVDDVMIRSCVPLQTPRSKDS